MALGGHADGTHLVDLILGVHSEFVQLSLDLRRVLTIFGIGQRREARVVGRARDGYWARGYVHLPIRALETCT
jgi:hypothetical protein